MVPPDEKIYCNGAFDLFHAGHVKYLETIADFGDVYVGVHSDADMASYKRTPVVTYEERCVMVKNCKWVCDVIPGTKLDITEDFIRANNIDVVVCTDYDEKYHADPKRMGILKIVPRVHSITDDSRTSTTDLIKRIKRYPFYETVEDGSILHKRYLTVWSRTRNVNGKDVMFDVVGRPGPYPNCVCIFPYDSKRQVVYMIKEYHQGTDEIKYGLPAGYYEPKKHTSLQHAAKCELSEEGKLKGGRWTNMLEEGYSELKWVTNKVVPFVCIDPEYDDRVLQGDAEENCKQVCVSLPEVMKLIREGKVTLTSLMTIILAFDHIWTEFEY